MSAPLERCISLLGDFVAYRTDNPAGDEIALCERLARELDSRGADQVDVVEVPRDQGRSGYVYARYGAPRLLLNVHIDTVPANTGWTRDPFRTERDGERIHGLGTSDIKGAVAAILTALDQVRPANLGILFSGDEERRGHCMHEFVASGRHHGLETALVCEPTARCAGVRHRGVRAYRAHTRGRGGHSSAADRMPKPIVTMAGLAVALDQLGAGYLEQGPDDMRGICMNVAALDGGVAFNVVPDQAWLRWSLRPPPGFDDAAFEAAQRAAIDAIDPAIELETQLANPAFATRDLDRFGALLGDHVEGFVPLQFWTEAAVLSVAGIDAVVLGPGDIAQAHAADEFVTTGDLAWAVELFTHVLASTTR